jgi:hypothetical protein
LNKQAAKELESPYIFSNGQRGDPSIHVPYYNKGFLEKQGLPHSDTTQQMFKVTDHCLANLPKPETPETCLPVAQQVFLTTPYLQN